MPGKRAADKPQTKLYLLVTEGVEIGLKGPYKSRQQRLSAARDLRNLGGEDFGVHWLDVLDGVPSVGDFSGGQIEVSEEFAP